MRASPGGDWEVTRDGSRFLFAAAITGPLQADPTTAVPWADVRRRLLSTGMTRTVVFRSQADAEAESAPIREPTRQADETLRIRLRSAHAWAGLDWSA